MKRSQYRGSSRLLRGIASNIGREASEASVSAGFSARPTRSKTLFCSAPLEHLCSGRSTPGAKQAKIQHSLGCFGRSSTRIKKPAFCSAAPRGSLF